MLRWLFILIFMVSHLSFAQEMRIGLLRSLKVKTVNIGVNQGTYAIYGDSVHLGTFGLSAFQVNGKKVGVKVNDVYRTFEKVLIVQDTSNSSLSVKAVSPASKQHYYRDNIELTSDGVRLNIVNLVDMKNYLAGVIESEGGGGRHLEYYKVQALMSRTYALKNEHRHEKEGFQLCDNVHCQAYHNMLRHTPVIQNAVNETAGKVLVDARNVLVTSYFSANCGGEVCDASFVWNNSVPYVESFIDTFCIHTRQAVWTKEIDKISWQKYIRDEFGVTEEKVGDLLYNFEQEQRKAFFIHPSMGIPLRDLRTHFRLKSTFFSTHLSGNKVVIEGRGFGHGVGLCQEGAMNMAKAGFDYTQIARFYFHNVRVIDAERDLFFRQEGQFN